jgi:hypothetical protein
MAAGVAGEPPVPAGNHKYGQARDHGQGQQQNRGWQKSPEGRGVWQSQNEGPEVGRDDHQTIKDNQQQPSGKQLPLHITKDGELENQSFRSTGIGASGKDVKVKAPKEQIRGETSIVEGPEGRLNGGSRKLEDGVVAKDDLMLWR